LDGGVRDRLDGPGGDRRPDVSAFPAHLFEAVVVPPFESA